MSNTQLSFSNLETISSLNLLEDEAAATCSGGGSYKDYDFDFDDDDLEEIFLTTIPIKKGK